MRHAPSIFPASPRLRVSASSSTPRAFTLIEILCVVVIIGLTSAIIVPQIGSRDDQRVASASRALMADLLYAQSRSIAYQTRHYVQFNTSTNTYQVMVDSGSGAPGSVITHPVNNTNYTVTVGTGSLARVALQSASFDGNATIAFDQMGVPWSWNSTTGLAPMSAGSVVFKAGVNQLTVSVAPYSGEITVH